MLILYFSDFRVERDRERMTESDWPGYIWRSPSGHRVSPTSFASPLHHVGFSCRHNDIKVYFQLTFNFCQSLPNTSLKWSCRYYFIYFQASIVLDRKDEVGLIIRGGSEFSLGIYVSGCLPNSAASKIGLRVGLQFFLSWLWSNLSYLRLKINILLSKSKTNLNFIHLCLLVEIPWTADLKFPRKPFNNFHFLAGRSDRKC